MSVLREIVEWRRRDLAEIKERQPEKELRARLPGEAPPSFSRAISGEGVRIIAEIKYRSPSHGSFACRLEPRPLARLYAENGAAALSVLTESRYFGGELGYLDEIRSELPGWALLRKDFILEGYQVVEARCHGASACLLIVAALEAGRLESLLGQCREVELEALVEIHTPFELERALEAGARILGVNNRDLDTLEVSLETSFDMARRLEGEEGYLLVSESGLCEPSQIHELRDAGFCAFLIGSCLMDAEDPGARLRQLRGEE